VRRRGAVAAIAAALAILAAAPVAESAGRPRWNTRVLALVPPPGFPALAYVHPNGRVYEGTYDNPSGSSMPSRVFEYSGDGALERSWTIAGQTLSGSHGVQVTTSDARGRLVLLDKGPPRALLLDLRNGQQSTYATFADLPTCAPMQTAPNCSPAMRDQTPMPDYGAWGPDGSLYVTDYQQAVVWRVPPGGGAAKVWLADRRLDGDMFGTAGIALAADHRTLLIAQASSAGGADGNPSTGKLYRLAIQPDGRPGPLVRLWESSPTDAPDGFGIARSGRIYLALAGPASQIVVIAPDGKELERFPSSPGSGDNGSGVPFDTPSNASFLGTRIMVANQSFETGNTAHQAILDVETGEEGLPQFIPANAGGPVAVPARPARRTHRHRRHHRR
jgi:sugar lactone lactonase YvrE